MLTQENRFVEVREVERLSEVECLNAFIVLCVVKATWQCLCVRENVLS